MKDISTSRGPLRVSEWVLGIVGGIAVFLGLFILFGGDDQYIGIGGDVSWRVGDIATAWGYGLILAGIVSGMVTVALVMRDRSLPETVAHAGSSMADLYVHGTAFLVVNAFLWIQDIVIGDGLNYALWVTIPWAIGLAVHAIVEVAQDHGRLIPH